MPIPVSPSDGEKIAAEFVDRGNIDIAMGGGAAQFLPTQKRRRKAGYSRSPTRLRGNGFDLFDTRGELDAVPAWRRPKLVGVFSKEDLAFVNQVEERSQQPSLSDMVRRAIQFSHTTSAAICWSLMQGLMREAAQENNGERTLAPDGRTGSCSRRCATLWRTKIDDHCVCGDVAIGGMNLNGFPFRQDSGIALLRI